MLFLVLNIQGEEMKDGLTNLSAMEYPGRSIIIGQDLRQNHNIIVYAITGRSPSSQAREIIYDGGGLWVKPTDDKIISQGDVDLLIYPAIRIAAGVAVSNGKQTPDIERQLGSKNDPVEVLSRALDKWDYEPDAPTFTPRISGCICDRSKAALSIIKRAPNGESYKQFFKFPLEPGQGKMIATYSGMNTDPLPSFSGEPIDVGLAGDDPETVAATVYEALGADLPEQDFRVSVVVLFVPGSAWDNAKYAIYNRFKRSE